MALTVSEVAKLAGITVRTLHHYDRMGLVSPSGRSDGNYRLYDAADLERLERVLYFRELGLPLEEIRRHVDDPNADRGAMLRLQRRLLVQRIARDTALLHGVERALTAHDKGRSMTDKERFEVFGEFDPKKHEAEAEQRWGNTDAWKESQRRTKKYGKADWARFQAESGAIVQEFAIHFDTGRAATEGDVMDTAEKHRASITKWFYDCTYEVHTGLGEMYVADERFAVNYERVRTGLAQYIRDAIHANAQRARLGVQESEAVAKQQQVVVRRK